jgi:hypothetical protein
MEASSFDRLQSILSVSIKVGLLARSKHQSGRRPVTEDSGHSGTSAQQINDENHHSYHQQQVYQASRYMQAEPQKPQNQKHNKNCPKHN